MSEKQEPKKQLGIKVDADMYQKIRLECIKKNTNMTQFFNKLLKEYFKNK